MGFGKSLFDSLVNGIQRTGSEAEAEKLKYCTYSDRELFDEYARSGTFAKRLAIRSLLRERGYDLDS